MFLVNIVLQFFHLVLCGIHSITEIIRLPLVKTVINYQTLAFLQHIIRLGLNGFQLQKYLLIKITKVSA